MSKSTRSCHGSWRVPRELRNSSWRTLLGGRQLGTRNCTPNQFVERLRTGTEKRGRERAKPGGPGRMGVVVVYEVMPCRVLWRLKWHEEVFRRSCKNAPLRQSFTAARLITSTTANVGNHSNFTVANGSLWISLVSILYPVTGDFSTLRNVNVFLINFTLLDGFL